MQNEEKELLETFESVRDALMQNDLELISELYADDYKGHNIRGGEEDKNLVMEFYRSDGVKLDRYEVMEMNAEVFDSIGIIKGKGFISGNFQQYKFEHQIRFVDILVKRDKKWKYYFSQATEIQE